MTTSVGLIGCGRWGRLILRDLLETGAHVQVVAPTAATRAYALAHGASAAHEQIPPEFAGLDGFVVATPTDVHADSLDALVPFGRPMYVEKPLCNDLARARRLVEMAGDRLFVMDKWRYHAGICRLAELSQAGELGEIQSMRFTRLGWGTPHNDVDAAWVLMPHDLSICMHILGRIPPVAHAIRTADHPTAGGIVAVLGGEAEPLVTLEYSIVHPTSQRAFTVTGSRASALLADSYDSAITIRRGAPGALDAKPETLPADGPMPLLRELQVFVAHLQGGPPPLSPAADGLLIVERTTEIRRMAGLD